MDVTIGNRPASSDRRSFREDCPGFTTFTVYRDLRRPIVRVSADATLGWLIAEVEMKESRMSDGIETPVEAIRACVELYEKEEGRWTLAGNVSNGRP